MMATAVGRTDRYIWRYDDGTLEVWEQRLERIGGEWEGTLDMYDVTDSRKDEEWLDEANAHPATAAQTELIGDPPDVLGYERRRLMGTLTLLIGVVENIFDEQEDSNHD